MNLDTDTWEPFFVGSLFTMINGKGITQEEISDNLGDFIAVQSGEDDNGVMGKIDLNYCKEMNYIYTEKPCLTVARSGSAGYVSFQNDGCVVGDSAKILLLPDDVATKEHYLFLQTILTANRFKYSYGRKVTENKYLNDIIDLPVLRNSDGSPVIDTTCKWSDKGYIPDWQYMKDYIKSLHNKPLTTNNKTGQAPELKVAEWKFFLLNEICKITMGNKMDWNAMSTDEPSVNFIGRSAENNGVAGRVDIVYDKNGVRVEPYKAGCITIALGGSLGSTYLQDEPFYTSQNVSVMEFGDEVSAYAKLFLCTLIQNESLYKYFPFGRELNTHIKTDFGFTLPVDANGNPDWQFMEDYIKALPYGDRLEG